MLEDKHEVKCAAGKQFPSNGVENPTSPLANVTCLCSETDGCKWKFSNTLTCSDDLEAECPIDSIKWVGNVSGVRSEYFSKKHNKRLQTLNFSFRTNLR